MTRRSTAMLAAPVLAALVAACSPGATASTTTAPARSASGTPAARSTGSTDPTGPGQSAGSTPGPGGSTAASPPTATSPTTANAVVSFVPDSQWALIIASGAWHPGCPASQGTLRRVEVNFHGFDGSVHRGVLVVNADVATEVARIFTALFDGGYRIHRMAPIEAYRGDDNASMANDNTSAYNCRRTAQANASPTDSPHANGRAVDVNPYENPWVDDRCHCFQPDAYYGTHRSGPAAIVKGGLVWSIFTSAGWIWQDNPTVDYQHFDTGYPSRPR